MDDNTKRSHEKVYCDKCDKVFDSKAEYERHNDRHVGICETCPIDTAISKLVGLFKRR